MTERQEWFYIVDGASAGPVSERALLELLSGGTITKDTLVWKENMGDWVSLSDALGISSQSPPPIPTTLKPTATPAPDRGAYIKKVDEDRWRRDLADYSDTTPHPWRRLFARLFDTSVHGVGVVFLLSLLFLAIDQDIGNAFIKLPDKHQLLFNFLCLILVMLPNALFIGYTGGTLGKWFFGIKVLNLNGQPIGFDRALKREFGVWVTGFGLGLPIVYLFTLFYSFKRLKAEGQTTWDGPDIQIKQRPTSETQVTLNVLAFIVLLVFFVGLVSVAK